MYLYFLGMIPPLFMNVFSARVQEFENADLIGLLAKHLQDFYEKNDSMYIGMITPLLLALKTLI